MTDAWGVDTSYLNSADEEQVIADETIKQLRALIGEPPEDLEEAAPIVTRPGAPSPVAGELALEGGGSLRIEATTVPLECPLGYHVLRTDDGRERRMIVSPGRCQQPGQRWWGWMVQLYASRSSESWGMGDLADLRRLQAWTAELGGDFLMVNPMHAVAPGTPQQPSPYFPATRRFRNPIYLSIRDVPGADAADLTDLGSRGRALNQAALIDRDEVWPLKRAALEAIFETAPPEAEFRQWQAQQGPGLAEFATWCALADRHGPTWREWPEEVRRPDAAGIADFAEHARSLIDFHAWLQWLLTCQLGSLDDQVAVIQDLPIGVDPSGADAWAWQELLAEGAGVGAPPDTFNVGGQDWGMPPFNPWRLRQAGYQPFIDSIRATLTRGGGLRVDHVIGLSRLWWIPKGRPAAEGGYVRYPLEDLLDIVCLESVRAGAVVVGEDLGTVEEAVRDAMHDRGILSSEVFWFETDPPSQWPPAAMASVSTHDLPTVAGIWSGTDLEDQRQHGVQATDEGQDEMRSLLLEAGTKPTDDDEAAVRAAYTALAEARCTLLAASLDDALAVRARPNVPGSTDRDNWCLALPVPLDVLAGKPLAREIAGTLGRAVSAGSDGSAQPE